ncbi:unnamed protein product [Closterium sp. Yama58-4]|nr:unnamed protein product [Closterium sp. Yama58-4]
MPRLYRRSQLPLHIKRAICAQHVSNPNMRQVDLARWCFTRYGIRPDRSTIGRVLKSADRWIAPNTNTVRVRGGAYPELEHAMVRWVRNAGPAVVPLTLATIRDHVAVIARGMNLPPTFRCSVGWVRRAMRRHGIRCRSATGEAADQDHAAVRTCQQQLPQLLMYLALCPCDVYNFDETALYLSVLPRKTYGGARVAGRKLAKQRLTVGLLVNADGSHAFRPLVISKLKRPRDFLPDYDPEELCYWRSNAKGWMTAPIFTHFIGQLNAAMVAEDRNIVILVDNASSHAVQSEDAESEDLFGFRTRILGNIRLVFLPPNTTAFTQPLDQGLIATTKARYRQHWLRAVTTLWQEGGSTTALARFRPNMRDVIAWLSEAWMNIPARTIQRCWWRTGCLPRSWAMDLAHVGRDGLAATGAGVNAALPIDLDEDIGDVGIMIARLGLGPSAMPAAEFVAIDDDQPTCAEPGEDPLAIEPRTPYSSTSWEPPSTMQEVYDDDHPESREARRYARAASEMLIGYAKATGITPRNLCALFEIKNPVIVDRMERASPALNLNAAPPPTARMLASASAAPSQATPDVAAAATPRRRGRVLPAWMTAPALTRQQLIDSGVNAVMNGYIDAAEWMTM